MTEKNGSKDAIELRIATQFPEIEKMLQTEDFDRINKDFTAAYERLEKLSKGPGGIGKSSKSQEARKAMKAIERVMDLLRELLRLKYKMAENEVTTPRSKKK